MWKWTLHTSGEIRNQDFLIKHYSIVEYVFVSPWSYSLQSTRSITSISDCTENNIWPTLYTIRSVKASFFLEEKPTAISTSPHATIKACSYIHTYFFNDDVINDIEWQVGFARSRAYPKQTLLTTRLIRLPFPRETYEARSRPDRDRSICPLVGCEQQHHQAARRSLVSQQYCIADLMVRSPMG